MPNDVLCIIYYQGAYGPTIRIDTQDKDHLLVLKEIFSKLAKGLIQTLEMGADNFPEIHFVGLNKLILKVRFDSVPSAEYSGTHSPLSLFKKGFSSSQENLKTPGDRGQGRSIGKTKKPGHKSRVQKYCGLIRPGPKFSQFGFYCLTLGSKNVNSIKASSIPSLLK